MSKIENIVSRIAISENDVRLQNLLVSKCSSDYNGNNQFLDGSYKKGFKIFTLKQILRPQCYHKINS